MAGFHEDFDAHYRPLPARREYIHDLSCWTDDWKQFLTKEAIGVLEADFIEFEFPERWSRMEYEIRRVKERTGMPQIKEWYENPNKFIRDWDWTRDRDRSKLGKKKPRKIKRPKPHYPEQWRQYAHKFPLLQLQDLDKEKRDPDYDLVLIDDDDRYQMSKHYKFAYKLSISCRSLEMYMKL